MKPVVGLGLLLAGLLTVKGLSQHNLSTNSHVTASQVRAWKERRAAQELARHNTDFGFKFFKKLAASSPDKNILFSPLSISMAFSMLSLGAQDSTLEEIKEGFNFKELSKKDLHEGFHYLLQRLNQRSQDVRLDLGNMLFMDQRLQPYQKFLRDVKDLYNADIIPADFRHLEATQKQINDYVSQKTHGKISNLIKNIDPGTLMFLINCIYFRARWKHEFDPKLTKEEDFMLDQNKSVKVPLMFHGGMYHVGEDEQLSCTVLEMPYHENITAIFILPDEGKLETVEKGLTTKAMARWKNGSTYRTVNVHMPKMTFTGTYKLKKALSHLGISKIFEGHGDLTRISPYRSLKVGEAVHKAKLKMDEKGTEGAAGSGAQTLPMEKPAEFKLNRPFLMMIYDETTASTLFLGKVVNPRGT
ncbi:PREDICTED: serpin A12 [Chrysochloris asiatica]|uniref:Serpin A12 n=1 Tax=Chrysochloris asiatica TaxID=185453 RepID=A0A9B0WK95_CHRAS|nr:PREDICTED: serpin A12 [Chrysochloris asiatica]